MESGDPQNQTDETVGLDDARAQVRKACERLALLHYAYAKTLVDELGDIRGRQTAMNAIKLYAQLIGDRVRRRVEAEGLEPSPENFKDDLPAYGLQDRVEVVCTDGEARTRVWGCVMGRVWRDLGASDLGRIYCYVDPGKLMAYNPQIKQIHYKALPDGDAFCEMAVTPTTEDDRTEFARRNTDLSKLDR